jgi:predicted phosphodiesterase
MTTPSRRRRSFSLHCRVLLGLLVPILVTILWKFSPSNTGTLSESWIPGVRPNNNNPQHNNQDTSSTSFEIMKAQDKHVKEDPSLSSLSEPSENLISDDQGESKDCNQIKEEKQPTDSELCDLNNIRTQSTTVDQYFQQHQQIPRPTEMHVVLPPFRRRISEDEKERKNILVIGDVHGCFNAMIDIYEASKRENDNMDFEYVILVGDLVNKGPDSAKVIRYVRLKDRWLSVRGNHDDGALEAACGAEKRTGKKYKWVTEGEEIDFAEEYGDEEVDVKGKVTLSDEDVLWMSELPYSITIPKDYLGDSADTVIVHGGLIPGVELEKQEIPTMITIREVLPVCKADGLSEELEFEFHERIDGDEAKVGDELICKVPRPWANVWKGPQRIIFGHDARRGLQRYKGDWAIGLDSGAVYGRGMTSIILPERKLVSVKTKGYA